jgi:hypothetical protein
MAIYNKLPHEKWIQTSRHQSRINIRTPNSRSILLPTFNRQGSVRNSARVHLMRKIIVVNRAVKYHSTV